MKYVTYRRVSTKEQGNSGLGLEAQARDIALFLEGYSDRPYEIVGEFVEIESGGRNDRPELEAALALCRRTGATLLVAKLDRLSRRVAFIAALMDDKRLDLRVASMPHADKFQLHIYAALAEQEREFISARTKAALAQAKARGVALGGLRDSTLARNAALKAKATADAQAISGLVSPLRAAGASLRTIADALNSAKIPTTRGGTWHAKSVANVLARLESV